MRGIVLVEHHLQAVDEALALSRWAAANHEARRILRRTYQRYPWARDLRNIAAQQIANYVQTTLSVGITNAATTATLTSVAGLPTVGNFRLRIDDVAPATTFEIVEVSAVNVGTGVVTFSGGAGVGRGLEGTAAIAHNAGAIVGNDLTAAMLQLAFAQGVLPGGYVQAVVNQAGIGGAATDLTSLTITVTPSAAGRRLRLSSKVRVQQNTSAALPVLSIQEGATVLDQAVNSLTAGSQTILEAIAIVTPTFAAHTYKLTLLTGAGTVDMLAAATYPAFIMAEDIGQA